jgi:hypothetical protein
MSQVFAQVPTLLAAGNFTSSSFVMPSGINQVTTQFAILAADAANASASMVFTVSRETSPGSNVFIFDHGFTWVGGTINPKTGLPFQPAITVDVGPLAGINCKISINLSVAITTGVTVTAV